MIEHYCNLKIDDKIILKIDNNYIFLDQESYEFKGVIEFLNVPQLQNQITNLVEVQHNQFVINQSGVNRSLFISSQSLHEFMGKKYNPFNFKIQIDLKNCQIRYFEIGVKKIAEYNYSMPSSFLQTLNQQLSLDDQSQKEYISNIRPDQLFSNFGKNSLFDLMHSLPNGTVQVIVSRMAEFEDFKYPLVQFDRMYSLTSLDKAIQEKNIQRVELYLQLLVRFNDSPAFNFVIDRNIQQLLDMQINIQEYLESQLCFAAVQTNYIFSNSNEEILTADFDQSLNVLDIKRSYDKIMKLDSENEKDIKNVLTENFIINLPESIRNTDFIENLTNYENIEIFETPIIQAIIDYKWDKYTKNYFRNHFALFLGFLALVIFDIYYFVINLNKEGLTDEEIQTIFIQKLCLQLVCWSYLLFLSYYETKSMILQGADSYFSEFFNYGDLALIFFYFVTSILDLTGQVSSGLPILYSILIVQCYIKLVGYLRLYKGFSFLVSMLEAVFLDLKYFITFYLMILSLYAIIFTLLLYNGDAIPEEYSGINLMGYFIMSFRTSMGDFQVDNYNSLTSAGTIFAWIIWLTGVLFLNIILLNFIIAVISESYEKVMQKMVAQSYKQQAMLIKEREMHFSQNEKESLEYFPRFLILRRPVSSNSEENSEWQGFIKDIKKAMQKQQLGISTKLDQTQSKMLRDIKNENQKQIYEINLLKKTIEDLKKSNKNESREMKAQLTSFMEQMTKMMK
eukprot:403361610